MSHKALMLWAGLGVFTAPGVSLAQPTFRQVEVSGFIAEPGEEAKDLSGIACRPIQEEAFRCLLVNDESRFAQWGVLRGGQLTGEPRFVPLTEHEPTEAAGSAASIGKCAKGKKNFKDLDGEGVAWVGETIYVTGSHSCGRENGMLRASTHLLARFPADGSGPATLTWRLGPALQAAKLVGHHYNRQLDDVEEGLDIEGIAGTSGNLYFGLRAPVISEHAFILRADADSLFSKTAPVLLDTARVRLGKDIGIRDLAALDDGRLLLLSGPSRKQAGLGQALWVTRPGPGEDWPVVKLADLAGTDENRKAEGIAILEEKAGLARVLVVFEKPRDGGAREYRLTLP